MIIILFTRGLYRYVFIQFVQSGYCRFLFFCVHVLWLFIAIAASSSWYWVTLTQIIFGNFNKTKNELFLKQPGAHLSSKVTEKAPFLWEGASWNYALSLLFSPGIRNGNVCFWSLSLPTSHLHCPESHPFKGWSSMQPLQNVLLWK